jgi:hypothetical protein
MTPELYALARRAVACKGWKWLPGMLVVGSLRHGAWPFRVVHTSINLIGDPGALPDLTDAATLGCLLALVREACGDPSLSVLFDHDGRKWRVGRWEDDGLALRCRSADTEAEALVVTLEVNEIVGIIAAAETVS